MPNSEKHSWKQCEEHPSFLSHSIYFPPLNLIFFPKEDRKMIFAKIEFSVSFIAQFNYYSHDLIETGLIKLIYYIIILLWLQKMWVYSWKFKVSVDINSFTECDKCRELLFQQWNAAPW